MDDILKEMIDHHLIIKTLNEYCHGCDRLDRVRMASVYAEDSWDDHGLNKCPGPQFAELIEKRREGRQQLCTLRPGSLDDVVAWVQKCREFWDESFDRLELLVSEMKAKEKKRARKRK